jgi:raffinose/stachyose/melibiose transport system permease protein
MSVTSVRTEATDSEVGRPEPSRPKKRVTGSRGWMVAWGVIAVVMAILSVFPFGFMILGSVKSTGEFLGNPFGLPQDFTLENFATLLDSNFGQFFVNSILVTLASVAGTVVLAILAAYPLARLRTRLNTPMTLLFLAGIMVPVHVTLIPTYVLAQQLEVYDSLAALIGPYIAFNLPVAVFVLIGFFQQIPESLFDAAKLDGAGDWTILRRVVMPMAGPAISTVSIITFIFVWNEFVFALVLLSSPENYVIPLGLNAFYGQFRVDIPGLMAALTVATIPSIIFYLAAQERVVSGLAAGALRGE